MKFIHLSCYYCEYYGKVILKHKKLFWTNIFTNEMLVFADFVKKAILSNRSFTRWVRHSLSFIYLSCVHSGHWEKVVLRTQMFCWTNIFIIGMFIFAIFVQKIDFEIVLLFFFAAGIRGKKLFDEFWGGI